MSDTIQTMREKIAADVAEVRKQLTYEPELMEVVDEVAAQWSKIADWMVTVAAALHSLKFRPKSEIKRHLHTIKTGLDLLAQAERQTMRDC